MVLSRTSAKWFLLGLLPFLATAFSGDDLKQPLVDFVQRDWTICQKYAQQQGKLYYVQFTANWCAVCHGLDETVYRDRALVDFMSRHVVAHKVNVDDFVDDGYRWSEQYEVEQLPTILIFDEKGKLVERLEGQQQSASLLAKLQQLRPTGTAAANKTPNPPDVQPTPLPQNAGYAPYQAEKPVEKTVPNDGAYKPFNAPVPKMKPVAKPIATMAAPPAPGQYKAYELALSKGPEIGFGLQMGLYAEYDNLIATAEKIRRNHSDIERFWVIVDNTGAKPAYRLFFGKFATEAEAQAASARYRAKGLPTLVKRYENPAL